MSHVTDLIEEAGCVVLDEERIAQLESELKLSLAREESSKVAFRELHRKLTDAYLTIAQQQQKLKVLAAKLESRRTGQQMAIPLDKSSLLDSLSLADNRVSKLTNVAEPNNFFRELAEKNKIESATPPITLQPIHGNPTTERILSLFQHIPTWTQGTISGEDALFLGALIDKVRPDQVYEIGTASGASSALVLSTMATYGDPSKTWLHSYDITDTCYFDPARKVGDATREMVPDLLKNWSLNAFRTTLHVPREKEPGKTLYFIDANHIHPWPTLDLISLLHGMKPGDYVVLHDINLPKLMNGKFPDYGAQWLFEDWLGERVMPDVAIPNIGAVIIPEDKRLILPGLVHALSRPWPNALTKEMDHVFACEKLLFAFLRENQLDS